MPHLPARRAALAALFSALALALAACGGIGSPTAAATVGGEEIPISTLESRFETISDNPQFAQQLEGDEGGGLRAQIQAQILTELIDAELVEQGAAELGVEIDEEDIAEQRAELAEQVGGEEALEQAIEQQGLADEDVEALLRELTYRDAVTTHLVGEEEITDADVEAHFEEHREEYERAEARHILVETEEEAEEVLERLEDGEDFAELAEEVSTDEGSAAQGGDLGEFGRGQMVPAFEQAVFEEAEVGEVYGPVESDFGFHVVEVTERETPELAEVEDEIREELASGEEVEVFDEWLVQRREQTEITVNPQFGEWDPETGQVVPDVDDEALPGAPGQAPADGGGEQPDDAEQ